MANSNDNSKLRKNKVILERLTNETINGDMDWTYLGNTDSRFGKMNVFISFINVFGSKNVIIELNMFKVKGRNNLSIYMENSQIPEDKIELKSIKFSNKTLNLSKEVLRSINSYSDDEGFLKTYNILMNEYDKSNSNIVKPNKNNKKKWEEEIIQKLYKKGDKGYWDDYVKSLQFKHILDTYYDRFNDSDVIVDMIYSNHGLS